MNERAERINGWAAMIGIVAALFIGAPAVFFTIAFMPALMNTKGAVVGYKIHRDYGETSIYSKVK